MEITIEYSIPPELRNEAIGAISNFLNQRVKLSEETIRSHAVSLFELAWNSAVRIHSQYGSLKNDKPEQPKYSEKLLQRMSASDRARMDARKIEMDKMFEAHAVSLNSMYMDAHVQTLTKLFIADVGEGPQMPRDLVRRILNEAFKL